MYLNLKSQLQKSKNQLTIHIMELLLERTFVTETTMASVECGLTAEGRDSLRLAMSNSRPRADIFL